MRDRWLILAGLSLFLALVLSPAWYNLGTGKTAKAPALKLPAKATECVAPVEYMKTSHMKLLSDWRDQAVRRNIRTYSAYNGKMYTISLTGTCLQQCHTDKAQFCDRCHAFNGVRNLYCWDCHVDPQSVSGVTGQVNAGGQGGH